MSKVQKEIYNVKLKLINLNDKATIMEARALRRAALTLHRWYEHECNGVIQRDEVTERPSWYNANTGERITFAADREKGAEKTIARICASLGLHYYLQTDPRGGTLYVDSKPIGQDSYNRATFIA